MEYFYFESTMRAAQEPGHYLLLWFAKSFSLQLFIDLKRSQKMYFKCDLVISTTGCSKAVTVVPILVTSMAIFSPASKIIVEEEIPLPRRGSQNER